MTTPRLRRVLAAAAVLVVGAVSGAAAATWYVDDGGGIGIDFTKIQEAVDTASDGDSIYVYNGIYNENVDIRKSLTLTGEDKNNTIIEGGGSNCISVRANNTNISEFTVKNGRWGILLCGDSNIATNNIAKSNNLEGINLGTYIIPPILAPCTNSVVSNNIVISNGYSGIRLFYSYNNTIINNSASLNGIYGIELDYSSNNLIYHNNFINNTKQASDAAGSNSWDNGYPSGGNYWSDYTGVDQYSGPNQDQSGSDGIGDTPYYNIIGGGTGDQDRYPLMQPWTGDTSQKGDLNGDGILTPADAAIALRLAATGAHDPAADVSGDGQVTSLDALMILQAAADNIGL